MMGRLTPIPTTCSREELLALEADCQDLLRQDPARLDVIEKLLEISKRLGKDINKLSLHKEALYQTFRPNWENSAAAAFQKAIDVELVLQDEALKDREFFEGESWFPRGQPARHSFLEVCANTASGFAISYVAGLYLYPLFGFSVTPAQNFWIVGIYTIISIARSYAWRRAANWLHVRRFP